MIATDLIAIGRVATFKTSGRIDWPTTIRRIKIGVPFTSDDLLSILDAKQRDACNAHKASVSRHLSNYLGTRWGHETATGARELRRNKRGVYEVVAAN